MHGHKDGDSDDSDDSGYGEVREVNGIEGQWRKPSNFCGRWTKGYKLVAALVGDSGKLDEGKAGRAGAVRDQRGHPQLDHRGSQPQPHAAEKGLRSTGSERPQPTHTPQGGWLWLLQDPTPAPPAHHSTLGVAAAAIET